jgi:hypothetical protein
MDAHALVLLVDDDPVIRGALREGGRVPDIVPSGVRCPIIWFRVPTSLAHDHSAKRPITGAGRDRHRMTDP